MSDPVLLAVGESAYPAHQIIEALTPHMSDARVERMRQVIAHRLGSVALGLEDLHHNHNGAACLRTAEGLGLQDVVAAEIRNPYPLGDVPPPELDAHRLVTAHAHHWLDMHRLDTSEGLVAWARARGMAIFGAGPRGDVTLETLPVDRPLLLLFGNEKMGLRDETLDACDACFRIPMYGFTESFNVSVSVGLALGAVVPRVRARLAAEGRTGDLSEERQLETLARWCLADFRHADAILRRKLGPGG
ncbi:MAG: TrmH family RNA methyltransferase [bacterium]